MNAKKRDSSSLRRNTGWLVSIPLVLCACVSEHGPIGLELRSSGRFDSEWRHYLQLEPHKSLAFAGDVEGRYAIGYGFEGATLAEAMTAAIDDCNLRRADKRIEDPCKIVAVDDELIGDSIREQ
jgi:hypothetical protein